MIIVPLQGQRAPAASAAWMRRAISMPSRARRARVRAGSDEAVQRAMRVIFQRYDLEPSGWAVVRWARQTGFTVPTRRSATDGDAGVEWKALGVSRLHEILKNPVYAGVHTYGRRRQQQVHGQIRRVRPDQARGAVGGRSRTRARAGARSPGGVAIAGDAAPDRKAMMRLVIEAISLSPIEVPRRATRIKVAWQSGTVTEIEVPRPHRTESIVQSWLPRPRP